MKRSKLGKRFLAGLCTAAVCVGLLGGCGQKDGAANGSGNGTQGAGGIAASGKTYSTDYVSLAQEDPNSDEFYTDLNGVYGGKVLLTKGTRNPENGNISYQVYLKDVRTEEMTVLPIEEGEMSADIYPSYRSLSADGSMAVLYMETDPYATSDDGYILSYRIRIFGSDGQEKVSYEPDLGDTDTSSYIQKILLLEDGSVCVHKGNRILTYDAEGKLLQNIDIGFDWGMGMFPDHEQNVGICGYGNQGTSCNLFDPKTGKKKATLDKIPFSYTVAPYAAPDGTIYTADDSGFYAYHTDKKTAELLCRWSDVDVIADQVAEIFVTDDEKILLCLRDWNTGSLEAAILRETDPSEMTEKTILTLGMMSDLPSDINNVIVKFNKQSDKYKIKTINYLNYDNIQSDEDYYAALNEMNMAFLGDDCPDMMDLSLMNVSNLMAKGVLTDLNDFFKDSGLKRSDFFENILDAYTIDGKLAAIPSIVMPETLVGKTSVVGEKSGWTLQDVIALSQKYPDAELMQDADRMTVMMMLLLTSASDFIDYKNLTCNFDTPEFKEILEFAATFPDEVNYSEYGRENAEALQKEEVLLTDLSVWGVYDCQLNRSMYAEPITAIGFPNKDGKPGHLLQCMNCIGVSEKSANKEGVYEFLKFMLEDYSGENVNGLYTRKDFFRKQMEDAMMPNYRYDENGEPMYDENGEPMQWSKVTYAYDNYTIDLFAATQEDYDFYEKLLSESSIILNADYSLFNMVYEEAQPFFKGQKSIDDVVKVIQSRVEIMISEKS